MIRCLWCALLLVLVSGLIAAAAAGNSGTPGAAPAQGDLGSPTPGVMPLDAKVQGKGYPEWGDDWSRWFASFPASADLLAHPELGQKEKSPVFLLPTWTTTGGRTEHNLSGQITVPAGKTLLAPVTIAGGPWLGKTPYAQAAGCCAPKTFRDYRRCANDAMAGAVDGFVRSPYASVDGRAVSDPEQYRFASARPFPVQVPVENLSTACTAQYPLGSRALNTWYSWNGYWLWLEPLSPGRHVVSFGSDILAFDSPHSDTTLVVDVVEPQSH